MILYQNPENVTCELNIIDKIIIKIDNKTWKEIMIFWKIFKRYIQQCWE